MLNSKQIIWLIDGGDSITSTNLDNGRVYIEFEHSPWKYKSFVAHETVFIEIGDFIYKVYPSEIQSDMVDVEKPCTREEFINSLLTDTLCLEKSIPLQCSLFIRQQGAGNGKTFEIIQLLQNPACKHYIAFVKLVNQHSAVHVLYTELKHHIDTGLLPGITIINTLFENKKWKINYTNDGVECQLIIATIDSFMYSLGNKNHDDFDYFEGIVNSIVDGYIQEKKCLHYDGMYFTLNKKFLLVGDEFQDLHERYIKALVKIMRNKYIDVYIVGDLLQSLVYCDNAFKYALNNTFSYINTIKQPFTNVCRRFYDTSLVDFVNEVVPYQQFGLPKVTPWKTSDLESQNVIIYKGPDFYGENDENDDKIQECVENTMKWYIHEVEQYQRLPNSFLIVTPFTKKNPSVVAVETAINEFWNQKNNIFTFEQYAFFHKSEPGTSINLAESDDKTRIVSIHSSKGDGRPVVFLLGFTERALIRFSGEKGNLIYESLLNVSFTRMKERLYIQVVNNGDDISQRIGKYIYKNDLDIDFKITIDITKQVKWNTIVNCLKIDDFFSKYPVPPFLEQQKESKKTIDISHHGIRYASMVIHFYMKIHFDCIRRQQISAILGKHIINSPIKVSDTWKNYFVDLKNRHLCLLRLKGSFYFKVIHTFMMDIKNKIKADILETMCPLEYIIFYYMISVVDEGVHSDITINELYKLVDVYDKSFTDNVPGHTTCSCRTFFCKTTIVDKQHITMNNYLLSHYERLNIVNEAYTSFLDNFPDIKCNINYLLSLHGSDFSIEKRFQVLGYDNSNVWIFYFKPQFNKLNYNDTMVDSICDTFFIRQLDDEKYNNKKITTIVFTCDKNEYYSFTWDMDISHDVKNILIKLYTVNNVYEYFKYHGYNTKVILNEIKETCPTFVKTFFEIVQYSLKRGNNDFLQQDYFKTQLTREIIDSVNDFLKIKYRNFISYS